MKSKVSLVFVLGGFFLSIIFLNLVFVSGQEVVECNPGERIPAEGKYCSQDGTLQDLKTESDSCLNDYECESFSCNDGLCQVRYGSFEERNNFFQKFFNVFSTIDCTPGEDECRGENLYVCGELGYWYDNGVNDVCQDDDDDNDDGNPPGPGGNSGSQNRIDIYFYSPQGGANYSYSPILLRVKDSRNNARYWDYQFNNGVKTEFETSESVYLTPVEGTNSLEVFASRTSSGSQTSEKIVFSYSPLGGDAVCGNGLIDEGEFCDDGSLNGEPNNCSTSCQGLTSAVCGNDIKEEGEECDGGNNCSEECLATGSGFNWWWIVLLILLILILIGVILYLRYRYEKKKNDVFENAPKPDSPKTMPPSSPIQNKSAFNNSNRITPIKPMIIPSQDNFANRGIANSS